MSVSLQPHELQCSRLPCPSLSPRACSNSCPLSRWCHPTISSSVAHFSPCPQSFPASESFPMSWLCIKWPEYWSFSFSVSPSREVPQIFCFYSQVELLNQMVILCLIFDRPLHCLVTSFYFGFGVFLCTEVSSYNIILFITLNRGRLGRTVRSIV